MAFNGLDAAREAIDALDALAQILDPDKPVDSGVHHALTMMVGTAQLYTLVSIAESLETIAKRMPRPIHQST